MCKKSDFMDSVKKRFQKIDIGELSQLAGPNAIRNFYLSPYDHVQRFFESETSFIFDGFTIGLCQSGTCSLKINGRDYCLRAGSLLLLPPSQLMELNSRSDDFSRLTIIFSLDLVLEFPSPLDSDIINMARHSPVLHLSMDKMEHLLEYYRFIERKYERVGIPFREEIAKTILNAMMLEISGFYKTASDESTGMCRQRQEQLSDDFFLLLSHHYKTERSVAFYAEKMNRTPKYLSGEIKRITGRSIHEWINEAILIEMKLQLKTTVHSILQISEELNFSSPSVFVQFFRHHTGMTPLEYRKSV